MQPLPLRLLKNSKQRLHSTLDYNYEAQFYGVFGSNRAEQSASYFAPVVAYQPVAAKLARLIAGRLRLKGAACNASLHFPAGGAPWGFQDIDTHIYMREWSPPCRIREARVHPANAGGSLQTGTATSPACCF